MIDILPPTADFSVGDYRERALQCVNAVAAAHKIPIVCGGTGFYINSLLYDLSYGKTAGNTEIRHRYEEMAREKGNQAVFDCLKQIDPETAGKTASERRQTRDPCIGDLRTDRTSEIGNEGFF